MNRFTFFTANLSLSSIAILMNLSIELSQPTQPLLLAQNKATNLARMRAETINGGISAYRADKCMYLTGGQECLASYTKEGFIFKFYGGKPGWQQSPFPKPTVETEILISSDGNRILKVKYNGSLR